MMITIETTANNDNDDDDDDDHDMWDGAMMAREASCACRGIQSRN